jgi:hypothetical protein
MKGKGSTVSVGCTSRSSSALSTISKLASRFTWKNPSGPTVIVRSCILNKIINKSIVIMNKKSILI